MSSYGQYTPGSAWAKLETVQRKKIHQKTGKQYLWQHNKLELHILTKEVTKGRCSERFQRVDVIYSLCWQWKEQEVKHWYFCKKDLDMRQNRLIIGARKHWNNLLSRLWDLPHQELSEKLVWLISSWCRGMGYMTSMSLFQPGPPQRMPNGTFSSWNMVPEDRRGMFTRSVAISQWLPPFTLWKCQIKCHKIFLREEKDGERFPHTV